jgi:hypothetical protein
MGLQGPPDSGRAAAGEAPPLGSSSLLEGSAAQQQQQQQQLWAQLCGEVLKAISAAGAGAGAAAGGVMMPIVLTPEMAAQLGTSVPRSNEMFVDQPIYVNAKQYHRIMKRRQARIKLEAKRKLAERSKEYMHESRHKHASRRKRGARGRFLTKEELNALDETGDKSETTITGDGGMSENQA